ncbi:MAG: 1-phosphofructokinase family hexose kinase [Nitriliruptorales bacterium]|nr:1-phosphofructokinase family hexose kinase [Nitriliruptorales bacterium]
MSAIATLTVNPSVDISTNVERMVPDDKLRADNVQREPGGGGINVARAVVELSGDEAAVQAVHTSGGSAGEVLGRLLSGVVETIPVPISEETRENLSVSETTTGKQYRLVMPGPEVTESEWDDCLEALGELDPAPSWLVASGSLPPGLPDDTYAALARQCRSRDLPLVLDTSGAPLAAACDEGVFLIKPNLGELARLVGRDLESDADIAQAVDGLIERGAADAVVVSMGAGGAYVAGRDTEGRHLRAPTVPIRSTVGAGDSMVAGIVLGLARGESLPAAARFGVAAGAAAVMTPGSGLCRRDDTEALYRQIESDG